jgi:anti-anti-sigma factor
MSFKLHVRKSNDMPILEISGELAGVKVGKIAAELERLRKSSAKTIAVDLSQTTFIDSHGLGIFVYCWRLLENDHRDLVFVNPQGFILNMFQNTNLDRMFKVVDSIEAL